MHYSMLKQLRRSGLVCLIVGLCFPALAGEVKFNDLELKADDRILVFAPHPDDEVLGAGGVLQKAAAMKLPIKVVFLTYGDSNPWSFLLYRKRPVIMPKAIRNMGLIRRDEAIEASSVLGIDSKDLIFLGYPDFGTLSMWYYNWNSRPPYRSLLTRANAVPYQGAFRPGALYKGDSVVQDLRTVFTAFKPTKIFVSHPADHNGDHLAAYLYTRVALWDEKMEDSVVVYPYLIHYLDWPKPKGFHPEKDLVPPEYLAKAITWTEVRLSDKEMQIKKEALQAHRSQYASTPKYLLSFIKNNELFGDFPTFKLRANEETSVFSLKKNIFSGVELWEEYNDYEKSAFVGIEWKFLRREGDNLVVSIELSKPLAPEVEASIYFFGYNAKTPFELMPKINVRLGVLSYSVYDQNKRLEYNAAAIERKPNEIIIKVPLALLGNPEKILTSARTYLGNLPLDSASWVTLELN